MRAAVPVLAGIALVLVASFAGDQPTAGTAAAVAAARTRQETVKTVVVEFKRKDVINRRGQSGTASAPSKSSALVPANELTLESINRLVLDGEKFRYENNEPNGDRPTGKPRKDRTVSVFDGATAKRVLHFTGFNGQELPPIGVIQQTAGPAALDSFELTPITLAFRGLTPACAPYSVMEMQPSGNTLPIDGAPCHEYVIARSADLSFWLDPGQDHVIRRICTYRQGRLMNQVDICYRPDNVCGWAPVSWVRNEYIPLVGTALTTTHVAILDLRLNESQPAEQFDLSFSPGTTFEDQRNKKRYRVQSDGSLLELLPSGEVVPHPEPWYWQDRWLLLGITVGLVTAGWYYAVLRKKAKAA